jgi:TonB family protein
MSLPGRRSIFMRAVLLRVIPSLFFASSLLSSPTLVAQSAEPATTATPATASASTPTNSNSATEPSSGGTATGIRPIGGGVTPPSPIHIVEPQYSEQARDAKFSGSVLVALIIDANGLPQNVHVVRGIGMGLDEKAIEAVKRYTFHPARLNGRPVPVVMNIEVNFQIFNHPKIIHSFPAELTDEARRQNFHGSVLVALTVDENGTPRNVHVIHPVGMGLDENAVKAAQLYQFEPTISNGIAVSVPTEFAVHFKDK